MSPRSGDRRPLSVARRRDMSRQASGPTCCRTPSTTTTTACRVRWSSAPISASACSSTRASAWGSPSSTSRTPASSSPTAASTSTCLPRAIGCSRGPAGSSRSELAHAAVGNDLAAEQERRVRAGKKQRRLRDFLRPAEALHGHLGDDAPPGLLEDLRRQPQAAENRRGHRSGTDGIYPDVAAEKLCRQRARERKECCLARRIDAGIRHSDVRDDGGIEDDGGAVDQKRQRFLNREIRAL